MLKIFRLTTHNLQNFSLFQLSKLFAANKSNILHTKQTATVNSTMAQPKTNGDLSTAQTQNVEGMIKFLELLGNLKVSKKRTKYISCANQLYFFMKFFFVRVQNT